MKGRSADVDAALDSTRGGDDPRGRRVLPPRSRTSPL